MRTESQAAQILAALERGEAITPLDALRDFGCMRLGARIWDLKRAGHDIEADTVVTESGKWVARYRMGKEVTA